MGVSPALNAERYLQPDIRLLPTKLLDDGKGFCLGCLKVVVDHHAVKLRRETKFIFSSGNALVDDLGCIGGTSLKTAAQLADKDGIPRAKPTILEPIGLLKVTIPDANLGDIMSDISSKRRGTVLGMTAEDGMQIVEAEVPMAEMSSYTIDLRSMTQGRGFFTCKFVRYEEAPGNVQQKVIEEAKALAEAE